MSKRSLKISVFFMLGLVSCGRGGNDTESSATDTAQTTYFSSLTAMLSCVDGKGVALTPINANVVEEGTGLVSQVQVPAAVQGGSCHIFLRGTPRPEYASRIRWSGVGPSAMGLAYVAAKVPVSRDPAQAQSLIANAAFIKTFEIDGSPTQAQPPSGQPPSGQKPPQGPTQPGIQTPPGKVPAPGDMSQGGPAPTDVVQALRAKGSQNISLGGNYCNTFLGQPWFSNPTGVYADESRGVVWTCRGAQVWEGSCLKGSKNSTGSCNP